MTTEIIILCVCVYIYIYIFVYLHNFEYILISGISEHKIILHLDKVKMKFFITIFIYLLGVYTERAKYFLVSPYLLLLLFSSLVVCNSWDPILLCPYTHTLAKMPSKSAQSIYTVNKSTEGRLSSLLVFGPEYDHLLISVGVVEEYIIFISLFLLWLESNHFVYLLTTCFFFLLPWTTHIF